MQRKVSTSLQTKIKLKESGQKYYTVISKCPVDRWDCTCQDLVSDSKVNPVKYKDLKHITCPRSTDTDMKKHSITCRNCNALIAYIHATSPDLEDWCNLHYTCKHDGNQWKGCMTVNISPIDGGIGFECTCGVDTRDFRANTTLPEKKRQGNILKCSIGRLFNQEDSKFIVEEI